MTVLEKIKRCVSLVWDFQEIYGEEDIEEFCHNELHTYPQHDEILDYFKHIEELEKENVELKVVQRMALYSKLSDQLAKAKGLILELSACLEGHSDNNYKLLQEAEQFLNSEVKK